MVHGKHTISLPHPDRDSKYWIVFLKFHCMSTVTFYSISVWLTAYLACFRYCSLRCLFSKGFLSDAKKRGQRQVNFFEYIFQNKSRIYKFTIFSILAIAVLGVLFCIPNYLYSTIKESHFDLVTAKYYYIDQSELNSNSNGLLFKLMFYSQAILVKLVPCIVLILFTSLLVHSLLVKKRNRKRLSLFSSSSKADVVEMKQKTQINQLAKSNSLLSLLKLHSKENKSINKVAKKENKEPDESDEEEALNKKIKISASLPELNSLLAISYAEKLNISSTRINVNTKMNNHHLNVNNASRKRYFKKKYDSSRTTLMLISICLLSLVSELPQCILTLLSIVIGDDFYGNVYMPLGDLMDIIAQISNAVNFILYCSMSSEFRETLEKIISKNS